MTSRQEIVIIGGGASGLSVLFKLIDLKIDFDCMKPIKIILIEKQQNLGDGNAYQIDYHSNLLNTAAGLFSNIGDMNRFILNNQPAFLKWLRENFNTYQHFYPQLTLNEITTNSYLPRGLVGIYFRHLFKNYCTLAAQYNVSIEIYYQEAIDIHELNSTSFQIILKNNKKINGTKIILALGNFFHQPFNSINSKNYFNNPWPQPQLKDVLLKQDSVAIIGTKLSGLDGLNLLKINDFKGRIFLCSRTGFLPSVKNVHHHYQSKILTINSLKQLTENFQNYLRLEDFISLLKLELEFATKVKIKWKNLFKLKEFKLSWFNWQISMAKNLDTQWQSVLAALDEVVTSGWNYLSIEDKKIFYENYGFFWDTYRFSMPLETALMLSELEASGQLIICKNTKLISVTDNYFKLSGENCNNSRNHNHNFKTTSLINATGVNHNFRTITNLLIQNVIQKKLAIPNAFGGFTMNFETFSNNLHPNIYMLGNLTKGTHLFTNSFLICLNQAARVATTIFNEIRKTS